MRAHKEDENKSVPIMIIRQTKCRPKGDGHTNAARTYWGKNQNRAHTVQYLSEIVLLLAIVVGRFGDHRVGIAALGHRQTLPHVGRERLSGVRGAEAI